MSNYSRTGKKSLIRLTILPEILVERLSTGITNLDALIEGGIPKGFTILLTGNPGTGKTILASHFLYEGLTHGESCMYVSFSESKSQYYDNFVQLGMKFKDFEKDHKFAFLDFSSVTKEGITDALELVLETCKSIGCSRLVIDSFSAIQLAFDDIMESRIALHVVLGKMLRAEGITNMLIIEIPFGTKKIGTGMEEFVADGIIQLEHGYSDTVPINLSVIKMRATSIIRERHISIINKKGMILYPKQRLNINLPFSTDRIRIGVTGLDERTNGGFFKYSTTALVGPSGSGKTTFGFQFLARGVLDGQISLFCSLEESADEVRKLGDSLGYNVTDLEKKGLHILSWMPENQSPDAFISELVSNIENIKPSRIVLDGLSTLEHLYSEDFNLIIKRLSALFRSKNTTSIMTLLPSSESAFNITSLGLSPFFHNIIILRYFEVESEIKRSLLILKMRASQHDTSIIGFSISSNGGIKIIGQMKQYIGIMSGIARKAYQQYIDKEKNLKSKQNFEARKRSQKLKKDLKTITKKEKNLKNKRRKGI
ncbi:MAG TPA: ATPase domain-containing protein [Nitrososphaeraceae archaeon]|nr:ATPase domain-containing protein [Nitrososphaeraceae archaeon]